MKFPRPLRNGDKIAILSPASYIAPSFVDDAADVLRQWGYEPIIYPHCKGVNGTYSGTCEERLADLQQAFNDTTVKAILCSRGGYGTVQLLPSLDTTLLCRNPKWVIGFSDISALHAAMFNAGIASIHASMARHLAEHGGNNRCNMLLHDILQGHRPTYRIDAHQLNRNGKSVGTLAGGNLAVLSALISTTYDILQPERILFIEDTGEEVYKVERMLHTLRLNGTLAGLHGLIVGQFTNCHSPNRNGETMEQMIARMVTPYGYPVAMNFPIGHIDDNIPLIEGAKVCLTVTQESATLQFL